MEYQIFLSKFYMKLPVVPRKILVILVSYKIGHTSDTVDSWSRSD